MNVTFITDLNTMNVKHSYSMLVPVKVNQIQAVKTTY